VGRATPSRSSRTERSSVYREIRARTRRGPDFPPPQCRTIHSVNARVNCRCRRRSSFRWATLPCSRRKSCRGRRCSSMDRSAARCANGACCPRIRRTRRSPNCRPEPWTTPCNTMARGVAGVACGTVARGTTEAGAGVDDGPVRARRCVDVVRRARRIRVAAHGAPSAGAMLATSASKSARTRVTVALGPVSLKKYVPRVASTTAPSSIQPG